jgi:hypothetical protein
MSALFLRGKYVGNGPRSEATIRYGAMGRISGDNCYNNKDIIRQVVQCKSGVQIGSMTKFESVTMELLKNPILYTGLRFFPFSLANWKLGICAA